MKTFIISFCWVTSVPFKLIYKGEERIVTSHKTMVKAKTHKEVISNLKGTNKNIISNINNIKEC